MKKLSAFLLAALLIFTVIPFDVFGLSENDKTEGYYTYTVSGNVATIKDVDLSVSGDITVPEALGGYTVTAIGINAFRGCEGIKCIRLPDSVTIIDSYGFYNCTGLETIYLGSGLKSICPYAFYNCTKLKDVYYNGSYKSRAENITIMVHNDPMNSVSWYYTASDADSSSDEVAFSYDKTNLTATVIGCNETATKIVIPSSVVKDDVTYSVIEIQANAFKNRKYLESATISDGVTKIGDSAFYNCTALQELWLGKDIEHIGANAFYGCKGLKDIYYSGSYKDRAEKIHTESSSENLSLATWHYAVSEDLIYVYDEENLTATVLEGNDAAVELIIPSTVTKNGVSYTVTAIGSSAFFRHTRLNSISIPDSVTEIGSAAFSGCTGLQSVTLGKGLKSIGNLAFYNCSRLGYVVVEKSVTSIGKNAFLSCGAFCYCYKESVAADYCAENNLPYVYIDGNEEDNVIKGEGENYGWSLDKRTGGLEFIATADNISLTSDSASWQAYGQYVIFVSLPNEVKIIGEGAFKDFTKLNEVKLPNDVTEVGNSAFEGCLGLKEVTLGSNLTAIGESAFEGCISLQGITLPESITEIGTSAFKDCINLTTVEFNAINCRAFGTISSPLFNNCTSLVNVSFGNNVTVIPSYAFARCDSIESISLPDSVKEIENNAFDRCTKLKSVEFSKQLTKIGEDAFCYCLKLEKIDIPDSVITIGPSAFIGCQNNTKLTIGSGVEYIENNAFYNNRTLTEINLPSGLKKIGKEAFAKCSSIKSVTIPESVTSIESNAFVDCGLLESVNVANGNEYYSSIDGIMFDKEQTSILLFPSGRACGEYTIPSYVTVIGEYAFSNCSRLKGVVIPNSVTDIREYAFSGCIGLEELILPSDAIKIESYAFSKCSGLKSITIPEGIDKIGFYAFSECTSLEGVVLPNSLKIIDNGAFANCSALKKIDIPQGVESIEGSAFSNCSRLYSITIPNSVERIGSGVFAGCTNLMEITIPYKVESIKSSTFDEGGKHRRITVYNPNCYFDEDCGINYYDIIYGFVGSTAEEFANKNTVGFIDVETVHSHTFINQSCTTRGWCTECGNYENKPSGHKYSNACDSICNVCNATRTPPHKYTNSCDTSCNLCKVTRKIVHKYVKKTVKATLSKNGYVLTECSVCGRDYSKSTIYYPKTVKLSSTSCYYNGKIRTPAIVIKDSKGKEIPSTYYTVAYATGRKNVGRYAITIRFKGKYSGAKNLYFNILPPKTTISRLTAGKKSFTATITKKSAQVTGYQIQYTTNKSFSGAKTKTIRSYKTTKVTLSNLTSKKYYYVRVRTYKTVSGKHYYSGWSTLKYVKTK